MASNPTAVQDISLVFIELGAAIVGLAILSRVANRWGFSAIPLYLLAGLAFGNGGLLPLNVSENFNHIGAEIGVILLLFMLGLEYTGEQLKANLSTGLAPGIFDLVVNFAPGFLAGVVLGWKPLACTLLGGVTYISSSGVIAKVLTELGWQNNDETPTVITILVLEDLAMALFLPLAAVLLIGQDFVSGLRSILIALLAVGTVLTVALRYSETISRMISHESDEIILLSTFGIILLVAGLAQRLQVSAAVGAFLVGIALSGPMVEQAHRVFAPLRDLFAAIFFFFFGLQVDPASLPPVLPLAIGLAIVTAITKFLTGWWAAGRSGTATIGRLRAGGVLIPRGEFSIVIAAMGVNVGLEPQLGPLSAAYVLLLVVAGPVLARSVEPCFALLQRKRAQR